MSYKCKALVQRIVCHMISYQSENAMFVFGVNYCRGLDKFKFA